MARHRRRGALLLGALAVSLAACGVSAARTANPNRPHLLLIGDSLMGNTATALPKALAATSSTRSSMPT
jgi:hypothetical protein